MTGSRLGASIWSSARSWTLVGAHHARRVAALVGELHLDAAVGALDDVEVGEDVAGLVENEAGALALLRNRAIKEVEDQRGGGDVDHRGQDFLVDGDIVLLFGVVGGRSVSLSQLERRVGAAGAVGTARTWDGRRQSGCGKWVVRNQNPPSKSKTMMRMRLSFMDREPEKPS